MAGASDPLEDMLFTEVDEKAVSDLVGSLESQLGDRKAPAASFTDGKRETGPAGASQFSGKVRERVGSSEQPPPQPQQGHPKAGSNREPSAAATDGPAVSGGALAASTAAGTAGVSAISVTPQPSAPAPFHPAVVPTSSLVPTPASPGLQSLNGGPGSVKLLTSPSLPPPQQPGTVINAVSGSTIMASQFTGQSSPTITLQRHPSPVPNQNGVDPKSVPSPNASTSQVLNHTNQLIHNKIMPQPQPVSGNSVILANTPPLTTQIAQTGAAGGVKPAVNGLAPPTVAVVRPPGASPGVAATGVQQQRPALGVNAAATRAPTPQAPIAVRPQQQTTIQLPPGFTMPPGMVLVRTETGQLVMVPQQVLAQAQAKTQQNQTVNLQRPATPTAAGGTIRVSTPTSAPGTPTVRLASPQTRLTQPASSTVQALSAAPGGSAVSVKMSTPQKPPTVITAGGTVLNKTSPSPSSAVTAPARVNVVSQEMQENVKKCKNFLATLIKLASHNSPSPDTSKNVKGLVQDLLDAKIEPEEFTTRLQAELKSSPQPYLIPFLKKSLPALRQSLLSNQQSLMPVPSTAAAVPPVVTTSTIRPPLPISPATSAVRLSSPMGNATTLAVARPGAQTVTRPVVISQNLRPQGTLIRGPATILGKSPIMAAQANQRKLSDPGGGTFRDDDDINDVASMAGVNLNEENARILATSSELVGTMIRSCKDEAFLPPGMLHRRILDIAKRSGVSEVPVDVVNLISHATQSRLRTLLEKVSVVAQHRTDGGKDEDNYEQTSDVRSQLRFFEQLERMEKQRKDEQEREILLKAAKSRARQEDPEQARLKQKAKEMQQQELAQMRQRDANLTALAAIGPRKKRKLDSPGGATAGPESASGSGLSSSPASSRQQLRQRITRVNLRDFIFCLEQERTTARSLMLYKALLK
ncbi:transcription initiation factor TFIID subunit 4-like isoform X2 [Periophthalmus magnuspinnatus]|uniref:transcription initiation factor TFIID subunit 4-like isoform X2 n=1 Tax=Periophthalmus magnuspinnatus TaxID=409849 RepID=UPI0024367FDB|nr:transcription initiation factor TFIID subunit 4-like isoform X2 [Periophthalmus magnuspinnatus]